MPYYIRRYRFYRVHASSRIRLLPYMATNAKLITTKLLLQ